MTLTEWAYALLGVLVGIIFVLDGWRSPPDSAQSLRQSPKLRGLLFVLGAGVIPVIQTLTTDEPEVLALYSLCFVGSTLLLLFALTLYAVVVAHAHLQETHPEQRRIRVLIKALPLAALALQEGLPSFQARLDQLVVRTLIGQRNWAIDFQLGYLEALVHRFLEREPKRPVPTGEFVAFVDHFLATVLTNILEGARVLENYRASLYFMPPGASELVYVTGFAPKTAPHTKRTLPLEGSLAGLALSNPPRVYEVDVTDRGTEVAFHRTGQRTWYKAVAAVAVRPLARGAAAEPNLVLCIDSKRSRILDPLDYNRRMIFALSLLLGNAAISMGIDGKALEAWLGLDRPHADTSPPVEER